MLSVIVPYRNEEMLGFTVQRLHETISVPYEIITVDDGSNSPVDIPPGVKHIRFNQSIGAQLARHVGIEAARYDTVLVIDAHMNFWDDDWAKRLVDYNVEHPTHVGCVLTLGLQRDRMEMEQARGPYAGAHIILKEISDKPNQHYVIARRVLVDKWNKSRTPGEVGCVLGGAYFMSRNWYLETLQAPWAELRGWGILEANISIPNYLLGGKNVCFDIEIGHMFRQAPPFHTNIHNLLFNELYLVHVVVPDPKERDKLIAQLALPDDQVAQKAWAMLNQSIHSWYRRYLVEKGIRTWADYKTEWMDPSREY
ncbi:MAG: glycosyltransferase family 2 protein [Anaerolineae bacterium]|nr:glycosyltransferase family 2 protein [Anaerolineae bacterium]